jgi:[ribosomal protein S5]-alanine N-acetyltransferase
MDVRLRPLGSGDAALLARLYVSQHAFMTPYDPPRPDSFYTEDGQRLELDLLERERAADRLYRFLIEADGVPAGAISVSRITRGPFQNGGLGYWVSEELNGRGIATAAVARVCEWGFGEAGLHRLEAATLVDNIGSQKVLRRNGFLEIGRSPNYLFIAGDWRDHLLFAKTAGDARTP